MAAKKQNIISIEDAYQICGQQSNLLTYHRQLYTLNPTSKSKNYINLTFNYFHVLLASSNHFSRDKKQHTNRTKGITIPGNPHTNPMQIQEFINNNVVIVLCRN